MGIRLRKKSNRNEDYLAVKPAWSANGRRLGERTGSRRIVPNPDPACGVVPKTIRNNSFLTRKGYKWNASLLVSSVCGGHEGLLGVGSGGGARTGMAILFYNRIYVRLCQGVILCTFWGRKGTIFYTY